MDRPAVLVIEDEQAIRVGLCDVLAFHGFAPTPAADGTAGLQLGLEGAFALAIVDVMLPGVDGFTITRRLRERHPSLPLLLLTARGSEADVLEGFDAGADDYVTKPFSPRELAARIKAVLRRGSGQGSDEAFEADGLRLEPLSHRVTAREQTVDIGPTEYRLLEFFMSHPERVYSRSQLLDRVWGSNVYVEERTVDVHIRRLRKVLEPSGHDVLIQTVRGTGYRFSVKADPGKVTP